MCKPNRWGTFVFAPPATLVGTVPTKPRHPATIATRVAEKSTKKIRLGEDERRPLSSGHTALGPLSEMESEMAWAAVSFSPSTNKAAPLHAYTRSLDGSAFTLVLSFFSR